MTPSHRADTPRHENEGHGHGHGGTPDEPPTPEIAAVRRRATTMLLLIVVPLAMATALGVLLLWPDGNGPQDRNLDTTYVTPGGTLLDATVTKLETFPCGAGDDAPQTPGDDDLTCVRAQVHLDTGPQQGKTVTIDLPPELNRAGIDTKDRIRLLHVPVGDDQEDYYAFVDFIRGIPMIWLAIAYAIVVVAVARLRGLRALLGLGLAYVMLVLFMLPALLDGENALLVGLVGSSAIMFVVLYLAHGLSARTTTALLGTLFGLIVTALLAWWATDATQLSGIGGDNAWILLSSSRTLDLSEIVLCGIILAGLGVLNDVTITQASAVWELYELSPTMSAKRLFAGAMRIGRDHIASTVYTIAFAYAGAALPVLLLISLYQRPFTTAITSGDLAEEVVRTLVGSIGLVLAIPITTAIAVAVVKAVGTTPTRS
ncbi:YibE/F family protein [Tenggerimyces flavus]|uniref:YibE/F family protein n=1 Tax=Tenggerimyces flavus TaxID=1708749 RepID=A0ABV7YG17_9ACTN|nr:YibE/F family protein [Tenggerimyces flavus]MBM7784071.1 putative membrane protein [Tenggerimyces flavus]